MANQAAATISIGANTSNLERDIQRALSKLETSSRFSPQLNANNFALGRITGQVDDFNRSLDAANKRVLAFGANAAIIGGVYKIFKDLVSATFEVNKAMTDINAIFGLSSKNLQSFSTSLFNVARQTSQSFTDVSKSAQEFARQGLGVEETLKRVSGAMTLTRQSGLEVSKSVNAITAALNGFTKENLNVSDVVNKLIAVDTKFAVSSSDLAEALTRVGSTAAEAGVSFDQLIGLVTSAQQITARGGAVIGNALKTIFTRLERSDTLDQLENIGIAVRDLSRNALPATTILKNLAGSFDNLTESQKQTVTQLTAGTFQVNQLKAILSDLGRSYNTMTQAQMASSSATNEAIKRNEVLNQSLSALLQNSKTTATELGSIIGEKTFAGPLKTALSFINDNFITSALRDSVSDDAGKSLGGTIAGGMLKGIENVLAGPGIVAIGAILSKLTGRLVGDSARSFASLGLNKENELKTVQGIQQVLSQSADIDQQRYRNATSLEQKERVILEILQQQNALKAAQIGETALLAQTVSKSTGSKIRAFSSAGGYLPINEEMSAIRAGVGGASAFARPVVIPNFAYGGGVKGPIVANSDEYVVPNFAGGGSAIFNPQMVQKFGLPSGAKRIAAGGYIPNAAGGFFDGASALRQTGSNKNISSDKLAMLNAAFDVYTEGILEESTERKKLAKRTIDSLDLNEKSAFKVAIALEDHEKAIKQQISKQKEELAEQDKAKQKFLKEQQLLDEKNKLQESINQQVKKSLIDLAARQTKVATAEQFSSTQQQTGPSALALNNVQIQNQQNAQTAFERDKFLSQKYQTGRNQAFSNVTGGIISGNKSFDSLSTAQQDFLSEEFNAQGKALAQKTLGPGSSNKAVKAFVSQYVNSQISALNNAFDSAVAIKDQGSVFSDLQKRTSGIRGLFKNINKEVESIISERGLSSQAADKLRQQSSNIQVGRSNRLQGIGVAASFIAPFAAGFIPEGRGGTGSGQALGATQGVLQGAGVGLALGSFLPGVGTAIGGAVGAAVGGLTGYIQKASQSFEELSKIVNDLNAKNNEQLNNVSSYIALQQKLNDAIQNGASQKQIDSIVNQQKTSLSSINNPNDRFSLLSAGGNIDKLAQVLSDLNARSLKSSSQNDAISSLSAARNNAGLFSSLRGKDIEDAAKALTVSVTASGETAKKAFAKLKENFDNKPLESFDEFASSLGYDNELISSLLKQYKNHPDQLKLILTRFVGVFEDSAKDVEKIQSNLRKNQINIDYGNLLKRAGESNILSAELTQSNSLSRNRGGFNTQKAISDISGGDSLEKLNRENQLVLRSATNEANINFQAAIQKNIGKIQESVSTKAVGGTLPQNISEQIANLQNPEDFKNLADSLKGTDKELVSILTNSYNELLVLSANSSNQLKELKDSNKIAEILAKVETRNKILNDAQFNVNNLNSFSQNRITGRTSQFNTGGKALQFNALNSQIDFADKLGLGDTEDTQGLRNAVRLGSTKINFAKILSDVLDREVTDNEEDINKAVQEALDKPVKNINDALDKDFIKRIKAGIEVSQYSPEQAISEISKNGVGKFVSAGKVSIGEGSLISGLSALSSPLTGIDNKLGDNGPIATILKQIAQNRAIASENKQEEDIISRRTDAQKKLDELNSRVTNKKLNSLSLQDISSAFDAERAYGVNSSRAGDFLRGNFKRGKAPEATINELLNNQDLLNEYGVDKNKLKNRFNNIANQNPVFEANDYDQLENLKNEIKNLNDELKDLNTKSSVNLLENINSGAFSSGQKGRSRIVNNEDNFSLNSIDIPNIRTGKSKNFGSLVGGSNLQGQLDINKRAIKDAQDEYDQSENVNASYQDRISLLQKLNDLQLQNARLQNDGYASFAAGFKGKILEIQKSMKDLSDTGATVANSLENNLGNSFGDFVTGAKKGKDAFREFVTSLLNDSARAFASKAVQQLIGNIGSSIGSYFSSGSTATVTKNSGGKVPAFDSGGSVPALLTGGEYYFSPEQVRNIENRYGNGYVDKINRGQAPMYAQGGLVTGGSGVKDDVFAKLDVGGYVIKKSAVEKYGPDNIDYIANAGAPQKRFIGGFLIGALIGAGTAYATSSKKDRRRNMLIAGVTSGIAAGLAQNYSQTGSLFKSDSNASTFQFSPSSTGKINYSNATTQSQDLASLEGAGGYNSPSSSQTTSINPVKAQSPLTDMLVNSALAGAIGIGSTLAERKKQAEETLQRPLTDQELIVLQNQEIQQNKSQGQFAYLSPNSSGGQSLFGYGSAPATRRLAIGGPIRGGSGMKDDLFSKLNNGGAVIQKSAVNKYGNSGLRKFAEGGIVSSSNPSTAISNTSKADGSLQPNVIIKIDINNNGSTNSSSSSDQKQGNAFDQEFAAKLAQNVRLTVRDELIQQQRTGGINSQIKRQS